MRRSYIIPNIFTSANLLCGLLAIIKVFDSDVVTAGWLILAASIFDGLDGQIARLTKSESRFGLNFDSLADMVSFGIAPALLIYSVISLRHIHLATIEAVLFGGCCALRLARYNVQATTTVNRYFMGIPSPAAAGVIASAFLVMQNSNSVLMEKLFSFLPLISAFLMISIIKYPKINPISILKEKHLKIPAFIITILAVIFSIIIFEQLALFILFSTYLAYGTIIFILNAATSHPIEESIIDFDEDEDDEFIEPEETLDNK